MIFERLEEIITDKFSVESQDVSRDMSFKEDLAVDSLDLCDLVMALEEEFNIEIPEERIVEIYTVEDLIKLLKELGVEE